MTAGETDIRDREIASTRIFDAPRACLAGVHRS